MRRSGRQYAPAVRRFDLRQVTRGAGDQGVLAGALAITAVAGSELWASFTGLEMNGPARAAAHGVALAAGASAAPVYVPLAAEVTHPRLGSDSRRFRTARRRPRMRAVTRIR